MIVLLFGGFPLPPEIPLDLADHLRTAGEDVQIGQTVLAVEIALDLRHAAEQIFVHARIDENAAFVKELGNALHGSERSLSRGAVDERAQPAPPVRLPAERRADASDLFRVIIHVTPCGVVFRDHIDVAVEIHRIPMRGERIVQSRIDGDGILPLRGDGKRRDDVHALVELGIDQPFPRAEPAVTAGLQRSFVHRPLQKGDLLFGEIRIVRPLHELVPDLGVVLFVEVDLFVEKGEPFEGRHGAEDVPFAIHDAHKAFLVNVLGRLFVEPDEIERAALELLPALIAALEADDGGAPERVFYDDLIDDARFRAVFSAALHDDVRDPVGTEIVQDLLLRDIALHLRRERYHPAEHVLAVFSVRMDPSGDVDGFRRPAFRLARAVAAEYPAVSFFAFVKSELFLVAKLPRIVRSERVCPPAAFLLAFDREDFFYYFVHFR